MKKIIIFLLIFANSFLLAEIKDLDLIFIENSTKGATSTLKNAYKILTGEKNITARLKQRKLKREEDLRVIIKKLKEENVKLKKLLKIHDIDYEHADIKVEPQKKNKKMEMTITDK